jgi:hypothetical protein
MAFVFFGVAGLVRAAGVQVHAMWFYPAIFIGLGVAGLISLFYRRRAGP